jgi:ABC-2 type transport system permease protein
VKPAPTAAPEISEIDFARYHGWPQRLYSPWLGCVAIVRVALLQVFRRKSYWIVLGLGLLQFLMFAAVIYAVTQLPLPDRGRDWILNEVGFSAAPASKDSQVDPQESGYVRFMERQNVVVLVLLAFSGSLLVGADFRLKSLPFYLSRRIDKRHYIVGKLLAIGAVVSLLTTLPALVLFVEYGAFTSSTDYWLDNWRVVVSVLAYGAVLAVTNSVLLAALAAWLQKAAPIAVTWTSLFIIPGRFSALLHRATGEEAWRLLDPWRDMRYVGKLCFGDFRDGRERELAWWALAILAAGCSAALVAFAYRVRSVEIVE